jgi:hypothetical protein
MKFSLQRRIAIGLIALLVLPFISQAAPVQETKPAVDATGDEAIQPKFIWGILIKFVASKAFEVFAEWAQKALAQSLNDALMVSRSAAVTAPGVAMLAPAQKSVGSINPNVTDVAPSTPLVVANGKENYQGAMLSLLILQPDGLSFKVRAISEGFKSGEQFRIRIASTFDGELSLDNINPQGARNRLYPANTQQIVKIKSGAPVILPLDADSLFEFDDVAGEEKLVVTLRDPRAQGDATATTTVHRQENAQGTGLLQEVSAGKYPAIAESIALQHTK